MTSVPLPLRLRVPRPRVPPRVLGVLLLVVILLGAGYLWLRDSSLVDVEQVEVVGASGTRAGEVRRALTAATADMTTLHVRMDALRSAVAPFPVVKDVRVDRDLPNGLRITVVEHVAVAALVVGDQRIPVAADGTLLRTEPAGTLADVRVARAPGGERLTERRARRAVTLMAAAPRALRERAARVFTTGTGWAVDLRDGPRLRFGSAERPAAKWAAAAAVLADPTSRGAVYIDVRLPERPTAGGLAPLAGEAPVAVSPDAPAAP